MVLFQRISLTLFIWRLMLTDSDVYGRRML
jgi:hypothetical protein